MQFGFVGVEDAQVQDSPCGLQLDLGIRVLCFRNSAKFMAAASALLDPLKARKSLIQLA